MRHTLRNGDSAMRFEKTAATLGDTRTDWQEPESGQPRFDLLAMPGQIEKDGNIWSRTDATRTGTPRACNPRSDLRVNCQQRCAECVRKDLSTQLWARDTVWVSKKRIADFADDRDVMERSKKFQCLKGRRDQRASDLKRSRKLPTEVSLPDDIPASHLNRKEE